MATFEEFNPFAPDAICDNCGVPYCMQAPDTSEFKCAKCTPVPPPITHSPRYEFSEEWFRAAYQS